MAAFDFDARRAARQQEIAAATEVDVQLSAEAKELASQVTTRAAGKKLEAPVTEGNKVTFRSGYQSVSVTIDGENWYTFDETDTTPGITRPLVLHQMIDKDQLLDKLDRWIERLPSI